MKRSLAEAVGTFVLGFGGCGSAVLAGTRWGFSGVARLRTLAVGHGLGQRPISGCHRHQGCAHMTHAPQQEREACNQTRWLIRHASGPAHARRPWCT